MDRSDVTWEGTTETGVLQDLLGAEGLTADRMADIIAALDALERHRCVSETRQKILYHAMHAELGTWDAVAAKLGRNKSTVWRWAHPDRLPMPPDTR